MGLPRTLCWVWHQTHGNGVEPLNARQLVNASKLIGPMVLPAQRASLLALAGMHLSSCGCFICLAPQDFDEAGYKWTPELCRKDSDGDGFTNGQELGDPDCTWVKGQPQRNAAAASQPGLASSVPQPAASTSGK
jgi:hypothetical protein